MSPRPLVRHGASLSSSFGIPEVPAAGTPRKSCPQPLASPQADDGYRGVGVSHHADHGGDDPPTARGSEWKASPRRSTAGSRSASLGGPGERPQRCSVPPGWPPPLLLSGPCPTHPPGHSPQVRTRPVLHPKGLGPRRPGPYRRACGGDVGKSLLQGHQANRRQSQGPNPGLRKLPRPQRAAASDSSAPGSDLQRHLALSGAVGGEAPWEAEVLTSLAPGRHRQSRPFVRDRVTRAPLQSGRSERRAHYRTLRISCPVIQSG